jgi:hypothetical protein
MIKQLGLCLLIFAFAILSFALFQCFSPNEVDSFWIYSWATQLADTGVRADVFFRPEDKAAGTQLFHLIPTYIISIVYKLFGHGYHTIMTANYVWVASLAAALYFYLRQYENASPKETFIFLLIICAMEPVFRGFVSLRPEIIAIVLTYIGLTLMRHQHRVLPGVLSVLAIEAHITGIAGFLFILARCIQDYPKPAQWYKSLGGLFLGVLLGGLIYLVMHLDVLTFAWVDDLLQRREISAGRSPFISYFWHAKFKRHLPELVLIGFALVMITRSMRVSPITSHQKNLIIQIIIGLSVTELLGRGNYLYVVWWMLPFYLLCLTIKPRWLWPLFSFHLLSYILVFGYSAGYSHAGLAKAVGHYSNGADFVMGPNAVLPGTATASQFIHLAPGANIDSKYWSPDTKILVVSRDLHKDVILVDDYSGYRIGWYSPSPID